MPHLERLELFGTHVTDEGLGYLKGLKHLRHVDVRKTKITEAGIAELRKALPDATVLHGDDH
jgi:hypothetical protein